MTFLNLYTNMIALWRVSWCGQCMTSRVTKSFQVHKHFFLYVCFFFQNACYAFAIYAMFWLGLTTSGYNACRICEPSLVSKRPSIIKKVIYDKHYCFLPPPLTHVCSMWEGATSNMIQALGWALEEGISSTSKRDEESLNFLLSTILMRFED